MAQQIIDIGASANDGTGEPLRQAFEAVNENFTEIYNAGPVGSNVTIANNVITVNGINANLILAANGIGNIQANSSIVPSIDAVYNIGSSSKRIDTVYATYFVGNGSLLTGISGGSGNGTAIANGTSNVTVRSAGGNVSIGIGGTGNVAVFYNNGLNLSGNLQAGNTVSLGIASAAGNVIGGNIRTAGVVSATGNVQGGNVTTAGVVSATGNVTGNYILGNGAFLTGIAAGGYSNANVANYLPTYSGNIGASNINATGNIVTTANVSGQYILGNGAFLTGIATSGYGNANVAAFLASGNNSSNIITTANITASTLSTTGAGGNIVGANVITANTMSASANVIGGNVLSNGQLSATGNVTGNFIFGDGGFLTNVTVAGNVAATQLANGTTVLSIAGSGGNIVATVGGVSNVAVIGSQTITLKGNLLPAGNGTQNLGSPTQLWKDLYLSGNTLYIGDSVITANSTSLTITNSSGNLVLLGNGTITAYSNANVAAYLPTYTGNLASLQGNVTTTANVSGQYILGNGAFLTGIAGSYGNANVATYLASGTNTSNIITTGNISGNYFIGNGSQLTGISTSFDLEMHVSKDGNDSTGTGTILRPYLSITHALTQVAGGRNTIVIHPGGYTENPTITSLATQLITYDATGASTLVYGTVTIANTTGRIAGLKMTNLAITGNAQAYINSSTVDEQFTKSSSGYVEVDDCELQTTGNVLISGSGITTIIGNKINNLVVNNAGAQVLIKGANDCLMPQVTAGTLNIVDSVIRASSNTANAVTASVGTVVTLMNNQIVTPTADNVARVSIAGYHSIISVVYDKANSTLSNSLNSVVYFQTANVDSLVSSSNIAGNNISATSVSTNVLNVKNVFETTNALSAATGTVTHNCALGQIFVHSSISANFTANFTNVTLPANNATAFTLVLNQGGTAYVPTAVQIGGQAQTVNWQGGTQPAGSANKKDVVSFSVVNNNGTFITLGQLTTFG
jgi:hypothetical protein